MVSIRNGNLLHSTGIIAHQVNCKGVMGAGIAKQLANKYPTLLKEYRNYLSSTPSPLGTVYLHHENDTYIANLFGQYGYGRSGIHTEYSALFKCLMKLKDTAEVLKLPVNLPYGIGCGLAGGSWVIVYSMIQTIFKDVECTLWKLG